MQKRVCMLSLFVLVSCGQSKTFEYENNAEVQSISRSVDDIARKCGSSQSCLKRELSSIALKGKRNLSYRTARYEMFQNIDSKRENGRTVVYGVYSSEPYTIRGSGIPDHNKFNCEHTWPQSKFTTKRRNGHSPKTDLIHLFPTISKLNSKRGNKPFGEIDGHNPTTIQISSSKADPPDNHKGAVARAMFYMSIAYSMRIDARQEATLRDWNKRFPVTNEERERADKIIDAQGNINPFVIDSSLISSISDF